MDPLGAKRIGGVRSIRPIHPLDFEDSDEQFGHEAAFYGKSSGPETRLSSCICCITEL